jgi:hypothetical protein
MYTRDHATKMANPLLIVIDSIRRLGGLRRLAQGFPPVVQLVAALSTLALVAFSVITFVGGTILGGSEEQKPPVTNTPTVMASPSPEGPPSTDATPLPTGSLRVLRIVSCDWGPPSNAGSMAELILGLQIEGNRDFSQRVPFKALEDSREWSGSFDVGEEDWDAEDGVFVAYASLDLGLEAKDLGQRHDIIVRVDPTDLTKAFDPSNSETSVRVDIPATPPSGEQEVPCTSSAP